MKRDDLLSYGALRASKLRKFHALLSPALLRRAALVSYGGAQSNAMLALAHLCAQRALPFYYVTRPVPPHLAAGGGNFAAALALGMMHVPVPSARFAEAFVDVPPAAVAAAAESDVMAACPAAFDGCRPVVVPQGGAWPLAEPGLRHLAGELQVQLATLRRRGRLSQRRPVVFLASGTGTTAYYLAKHLGESAKVVTVPVSGDERYLLRQMRRLAEWDGSSAVLPDVLRPRLRGSFADVRREKLAIWTEMGRAAASFEFDLVYAPKAWEEVMLAVEEGRIAGDGADLVYYHSGGMEGNVTMLGKSQRVEKLSRRDGQNSNPIDGIRVRLCAL